MDQYDYIITGAGAAGLSLLVHMIDSGASRDKRILLVDKQPKNRNDRTWCFWEKEEGLFEPVVYKSWSSMWFHGRAHSSLHDISPYKYKLIRGLDFYNFCLNIISAQPNITIRYGQVERCVSNGSGTYVVVDGEKIAAGYIFNSILFEKPATGGKHHFLLQHFTGWVIDTAEAVFDAERATLMDFRMEQKNGDTTFVYVMPFSATRALVEFTVFGKIILPGNEYEQALQEYCRRYLDVRQYTIAETESGAIPMTDFKFTPRIHRLVNIGTAGGQTKGSSGYTFNFIQKDSRAIARALLNTGQPFVREGIAGRRFRVYDRTLLHILSHHSLPGEKIFSTLMESNDMRDVFKFLDNETSVTEELRVIRRLPKRIFLRAAWQ